MIIQKIVELEAKDGKVYHSEWQEEGGDSIRDALYLSGVEDDEGFKRTGKTEFKKIELNPAHIWTPEGDTFKSRTTTVNIF